MNTFNKTKAEIRQVIDSVVYGDVNKLTNWSDTLADALLEKRHHALAEFLSHGKGFNDSSKAAFCQLLNADTVLTQKGIDKLIAKHCSIDLEQLLNERKYNSAMRSERYTEKKLRESFGNGDELVEWVKTLFKNGFTQLLKQGNKCYLVNDEGNGYHLQRKLIREYAEALIKSAEINSLLS